MSGNYSINLSNGTLFANIEPNEVNGPNNKSNNIKIFGTYPTHNVSQVVSQSPGVVSIIGNASESIIVGLPVKVDTYSAIVASVSYDSIQNKTTVTLTTNLPSPTAIHLTISSIVVIGDFSIKFPINSVAYVSDSSLNQNVNAYTVSFGAYYSTSSKLTYIPVIVPNLSNLGLPTTTPFGNVKYSVTTGTHSSILLPGKGVVGYGEMMSENLIRMVENFASSSPPETNSVLGNSPSATPLVGQLWYDTTVGSEALKIYRGPSLGWSSGYDVDSGSIIFRDSANSNSDIYITASESTLPYSPAFSSDIGLVVWPSANSITGSSIFSVLSNDGTPRFKVGNGGYTSTKNDFKIITAQPTLIFNNGTVDVSDIIYLSSTLRINSVSSNHVAVVQGGGSFGVGILPTYKLDVNGQSRLSGNVGVNTPPDSGTISLKVSGDMQSTTRVMIANGSQASPSYTFTSSTSSGIFWDSTNVGPAISNSGTLILTAASNKMIGSVKLVQPIGSQASPSYTFNSNESSGLYYSSGVIIVDGAIKTTQFASTKVTNYIKLEGIDGLATAPAYSFTSSPNSGIYLSGSTVGVACSGVATLTVSNSGGVQVQTLYESLVTSDNVLTNKKYVDNTIQSNLNSIQWKPSVIVIDQTSLTAPTTTPNTNIVVDGITITDGGKVLFSNLSTTSNRKTHTYSKSTGTFIPSSSTLLNGDIVYVLNGTSAGKIFAYDISGVWTQISSNISGGDLTAIEALTGFGIPSRVAADSWTLRIISGVSGQISVSNQDGVAGNPTIGLSTLTDSGTGTFLKINRDAYGRVSGTSTVTSSDITTLVNSAYVSKSGDTMTGMLTLSGQPTSASHASNKDYVDTSANLNGNVLINASFDYWDYGTSATNAQTGYCTANRWYFNRAISTRTISRQTFTTGQTEVPDAPVSFVRMVVTGGGSDPDQFVSMSQKVRFVDTFAGDQSILSFYAKADVNGKVVTIVTTQNYGTGGTASLTTTTHGSITLTTSWARYSVIINSPNLSGKTIGSGLNDYVEISLFVNAGTNYTSMPVGIYGQSGTFDFANISWQKGTSLVPFSRTNRTLDSLRCKEYYFKSTGSSLVYAQSTTQAYTTVYPPFMMYGTVVVTNTTKAGSFSGTITSLSTSFHYPESITLVFNMTGGVTDDVGWLYVDYLVDAELY